MIGGVKKAVAQWRTVIFLCFLRDTAEAMMQFAAVLPAEVKRVALVDVNNDCVGDTVATATAMFERYRALMDAGQPDNAARLRARPVCVRILPAT